jgi:hypothetical protein
MSYLHLKLKLNLGILKFYKDEYSSTWFYRKGKGPLKRFKVFRHQNSENIR